nr:hypothetical protein Iba_chr08cCG13650 [Ipomoea batatas]
MGLPSLSTSNKDASFGGTQQTTLARASPLLTKPTITRLVNSVFTTLLSHGEAILSNFSELWHTPEVDLSPIFESDDNVTPFPDEPRHDLNILDDFVGEIASVLPGDDSDPEIGESVAEREGSENCGESERQPEKSETQKQVGYEVAVVGPAVEKDGFLGGFGGGGGGRGGWFGGDVESGDGSGGF